MGCPKQAKGGRLAHNLACPPRKNCPPDKQHTTPAPDPLIMVLPNKHHSRADFQVCRLFRSLSLQKSDSEKSTFSVHRSCIAQSTCTGTKNVLKRCLSNPGPAPNPPTRHVQFSEHTEIHTAKHASCDNSERWYSPQEIETFERQAREQAEAIINAASNVKLAIRTKLLQGAYELYAAGLLDYEHDMSAIGHEIVATDTIGLSNLASTLVRKKCHERLLVRIRDLNHIPDKDRRARVQCQASLCASHAPCLTAAQLGRWWASHCVHD